ncbi:hypothetical protein M655_009335 [Brevibacillus sp. NSP2.1]|uniref:hypothetical protein n=1 Tax=Brevibacillus sp. NSP2.1 TaxID=3003229 RepID=UPI00047A4A00|nr:hypothetical protein [Brevibacillus sp. NSP2.1]QHZ55829.1 hypothetical protein M655_009335 [Brevibacillus sp. NSP2.1]
MYIIARKEDSAVLFVSEKADLTPVGLVLDDVIVADANAVEVIPFDGTLPVDFESGKYKCEDGALVPNPDFSVFLPAEEQLKLLQLETKVDVAQAKREQDIRDRIAAGEITATTYTSLSAEEQELVTLVLFKDYSPAKEEVPKALSAVEFGLVVLFKLLGKAIDRSKLSTEEQQYLDAMLTTINLNDMPIDDITDWRYQYFHQQFEKTQQNRQDYYNAKMAVTGTW